jgi:hypothetical protein
VEIAGITEDEMMTLSSNMFEMIKINFTVRRKYRDVPIVVVHET